MTPARYARQFALRLLTLLPLATAPATLAAADNSAGDQGLFTRLDANGDGLIGAGEVSEDQRRLFDRLLRRADADRSGTLSAEEFARGTTPTAPEKPIVEADDGEVRGSDATRLLLLKLDTSGDGRLTRDEAPEPLGPVYDRLAGAFDRNKDGALDRAELARSGPQLARQASQIARRKGWDVDKELRRLTAEQGAEADRFDRAFDPARDLGDPQQAANLFKRLDANGDGELMVDELPGELQERFGRIVRRADFDRSGGVSQREFMAASGRLAAYLKRTTPKPSDRPNDRKKFLDKNESPPAKEESGAAMTNQPASADPASARQARRLVARMDRDKDGVLTRDEARGRVAERFDEIDINANGRLDPAEIDIVVERLSDRLRRARQAQKETAQANQGSKD